MEQEEHNIMMSKHIQQHKDLNIVRCKGLQLRLIKSAIKTTMKGNKLHIAIQHQNLLALNPILVNNNLIFINFF